MSTLSEDAALPKLRQEIQILPGIKEVNGTKSWLIFDPVRHQYFQIDDKSRLILENWHSQNCGEIVEKLQSHFVSLDDIESLIRFLWASSLTLDPPEGNYQYFSEHKSNEKRHWLFRLLHSYLFIIVPLIRPQAFLKKAEPYTRIFFSRYWYYFIATIAVIGLYLTSRQWDQFVHTFLHFFTLEGLVYYAITLCFIKLAHEFGHAFAATRYGCRIKSMGMAFIVMFPVLYTDTTDSWKLNSKKQRLVINAAGVAVELSLAAIATLVWALSVDGPLRSTAFFVATTSWILSVLINMNPLMRFDAYYFLSDALGVQNLQGRSFALGKWSLRKILFGLDEVEPESLPGKWKYGLTVFAWSTWVYRFFLFLGIAIIVHQMFFWPVGPILAVIELAFFIGMPIMNEIKQWGERREQIVSSPVSWVTMSLAVFFVLAVFVPWQSTVRIPAVLEAANTQQLFVASAGEVEEVMVEHGDTVAEGDVLAIVYSSEISNEMELVTRNIDLLEALLARIAADENDLGQNLVLQSELQGLQEELAGLQKEEQLLHITAPFAGVISDLNPIMQKGHWVGSEVHVMTVHSSEGARVRGFVESGNLPRIATGAEAVFIPDLPEADKVSGVIELVADAHAKEINISALASTYGGPIAVNADEDGMQPLRSWYHLSMTGDMSAQRVLHQSPGILRAQGERESIAARIWRRGAHVLLRELMG